MNELLKFTIIITIVVLITFIVLVCVFTLTGRIKELEEQIDVKNKKEVKK